MRGKFMPKFIDDSNNNDDDDDGGNNVELSTAWVKRICRTTKYDSKNAES